MSGETEPATASKLAGSKAKIDALLQQASAAKDTLAAACQAEGTELVAALRDGEQVQHDLSACIADYRTVLEAETSDDVFFKVVNLPQWPCARFTAWLSRNKVTVKNVEKNKAWTHAILTVHSHKARDHVSRVLSSKAISGVFLGCCEVGETAPAPGKVATGPPQRPHSGSSGKSRPSDGARAPPPPPTASASPSAAPGPAAWKAPASATKDTPKAPKAPDTRPPAVQLKDKMCPLWAQPYSEQLKAKYAVCWDALVSLSLELAQATLQTARPDWLRKLLDKHPSGSPCCAVEPIVRSPEVRGFRNRADFTLGFDAENKPVAGHLMGLYREGVTYLAPPDELPIPSATAIGYAALMTRFLNSDRASLPTWDKTCAKDVPASRRGFWRALSLREGRHATHFPPNLDEPPRGDLTLATLDVQRFGVPMAPTAAPQSAPPSQRFTVTPEATAACDQPQEPAPPPDELLVLVQVNMTNAPLETAESELRAWAEFVRHERPAGLMAPTALCFHHSELLGNGIPVDAVVKPVPGWEGDRVTYSDTLGELRFCLNPNSYFQATSPSAALMYRVITNLARPAAGACVLDLCCGVGVIGVALAPRCASVIGVDTLRENIADGRLNAAALGADNCTFLRGAAEATIRDVLQREAVLLASELVAVIHPPRGGIHRNLLWALLDCPKVKRIVYACSGPESVIRDVLHLVTPARSAKRRHQAEHKGNVKATAPTRYQPFRPVKMVPLDMSPHTGHVEMIMLLER